MTGRVQGGAPDDVLSDVTPYLLPTRGILVSFLCRWPDGAAVSVALPQDATPDERVALEAALRAWQESGLGVRFAAAERPADIEIAFPPPDDPASAGAEHAGTTLADCRVSGTESDWAGAPRLDAALVHASVTLARRTPGDVRGHDRPMTLDELTGAALHELGHALGLQGHVRRPRGVMGVERELVTQVGRRVREGGGVGVEALRALYAQPSGAVVRRIAVSPARTELADRLATLGRARGLAGPIVRVGDRAARIAWRESDAGTGAELGLVAPDPRGVLREPGRLVLLPERGTRAALDAGAPAAR